MNAGDVVGGRYRVESKLGEGGMAAVYKVRHTQLDSMHALKVLKLPAQSIRERLLQEGKVQARLRHRNLVAVTDTVEHQGAPGLIMEFIDGPSLFGFLRQNRLNLQQADALAKGILAGVAYAHDHGLVHRDLKPENILLAFEGHELVPKVADFGLAKLLSEDAGPSKTRSGMAMGTPNYMAPEQIRDAKHVDGRADIFALGAILYELVSGQQCFHGGDTFEIFSAVANVQYRPTPEVVPGLPDRMTKAIDRALQLKPEDRPSSVTALREIWTDQEGAGRQLWSRSMVGAAPESALGGGVAEPANGGGSETFAFLGGPDEEEAPPETSRDTLAPALSAEEEEPAAPAPPVPPSQASGGKGKVYAALGVGLLLVGVVGAAVALGGFKEDPVPVDAPPEPVEAPVEEPVEVAVEEPAVEEPAEAPVERPAVAPAKAPEKAPEEKPEAVAPPEPAPPKVEAEPVVAEPEPEPEPEESAPVTTATVVLKGDAKSMWFEGGGQKHPIRGTVQLPPGTYTMTAFFEGLVDPQAQGSVTVNAGQTLTVTCSGALATCNAR